MKKIYIAGPMTGLGHSNRPAFFSAHKQLEEIGYIVLNPAILPTGLSEPAYMDICLAMLRNADEIYLLKNWRSSAGATAEYHYAYKLGQKVTEQ